MKQNNGRLILKVKKRRDSFPLPHKYEPTNTTVKDNTALNKGKKRLNPFSKTGEPKKQSKNIVFTSPVQNNFFNKLDSCSKKSNLGVKQPCKDVPANTYGEHIFQDATVENIDTKTLKEKINYEYESDQFPLDWSLKHRVRFISKTPFSMCNNIRSINESKGIVDFTRKKHAVEEFSSSLHYWIYPNLPGISNLPTKTKSIVAGLKENKNLDILSENKLFQDLLLQQWRMCFQSLFNMLKTGYCPYFYLCCYQFTALFKACGIGEKEMSVVITPTMKGFREMLTDEGISFEFPHKREHTSTSDDWDVEDEQETDANASLNDSNNDEFLDSIGLNRKLHFPSIEDQKRLKNKADMRQLDNRPESTIKILNCQGLFNFLLNATFLCAPSGNLMGVPPSLISPSSFEGATLSKCRSTHGPMRHQRGTSTHMVYCADITGYILPTQLKVLVNVLTNDQRKDLIIHTKSYDKMRALNINIEKELICDDSDIERFGVSDSLMEFLHQTSHALPDTCDVQFLDNQFKY